jgi:hypothetical protein
VSNNDDTDIPNDNNPCTVDLCTSGVPSHPPVAPGTSCGSALFCDGAGVCVSCLLASDCPGSDTECQTRTCTAGACGVLNAANGTVTTSQTAGDCHKNQCDNAGAIVSVVDDTDIPNDNKECTTDTCASGTAANTPVAVDTNCSQNGGKVCDAAGVCGPYNLAGNGNVEYGTADGWGNFCGGTTVLNNTTANGYAHTGQYSFADTARTQNCAGPSYKLPTGPGKYIITGWGMQNDNVTFNGSLQIGLQCGTATSTNHYPSVGYNVSMPQGVWVKFSATVDTTTGNADCVIATPGDVRSALLYLNQNTNPATPAPYPNLYLDDVTDGHNLIGVPTFEVAGVTSGWGNNGGGTLATNTTNYHSGNSSLGLTTRAATSNGPAYSLPLGKAAYNLSVWAMHTGTSTHNLSLSLAYRCLGETSSHYPTLATVNAVAGNTWTQLSVSNLAMPPTGAPAGCKLIQANFYVQQEGGTCGTIECPDLFIDDASLTVAP